MSNVWFRSLIVAPARTDLELVELIHGLSPFIANIGDNGFSICSEIRLLVDLPFFFCSNNHCAESSGRLL